MTEIEAGKTAKGGFTRAQLQAWGVPWPPPKGWLKALKQEARLGIKPVGWPVARPVARPVVKLFVEPVVEPVVGPAPVDSSGRSWGQRLGIAPDVLARYAGPEPDDPAFDSRKHGLLAPPRMKYRRLEK